MFILLGVQLTVLFGQFIAKVIQQGLCLKNLFLGVLLVHLQLLQVYLLNIEFFFLQYSFLVEVMTLLFAKPSLLLDLRDGTLQILYGCVCYRNLLLGIELVALYLLVFGAKGIESLAFLVYYALLRY